MIRRFSDKTKNSGIRNWKPLIGDRGKWMAVVKEVQVILKEP